MHRPGIARSVGLIVVAVVVVGLFLYFGLGSTIGRPDESNRVYHRGGFSAAGPTGWQPEVHYATEGKGDHDSLSFNATKTEGRPMSMVFTRRDGPPDEKQMLADGYEKEMAVGRSVWHKELPSKRDHVDIYVFDDHGEWFEFITTRHLGDYDDAAWLRYLAAFRTEPKKPLPATLPTTLPAAF